MQPPFDLYDVSANSPRRENLTAVVAGPSSTLTIPGLMTAEVVGSMMSYAKVTRVAVDFEKDFNSGLHRAPALSAAHHKNDGVVKSLRAPLIARQRRQEFRQYFKDRVDITVALAWPGLDNRWIGEFVHVANQAGATTVVLKVSHPTSNNESAAVIAREVVDADLVLVGDIIDATILSATLGRTRPVIEVNRALSLTGRRGGHDRKRLTAFLPKDDELSLTSVLTAFDAIPSDWIDNYDLRIIMRYSGRAALDHVAASFHNDRVELIGDDFSGLDLHQIVSDSSALSVADPAFDSRAFATAVDEGVATVVLADEMITDVGEGYVGGLLADINRPTSVHVAHSHALRLSELKFPSPSAWFELASRLNSATKTSGIWSEASSSQFA